VSLYKKGTVIFLKITEVILIGFALSIDAFAIALTSGITAKNLKFMHALKIALFFGIAQGIMPIIDFFCFCYDKKYRNICDISSIFGVAGAKKGLKDDLVFKCLNYK